MPLLPNFLLRASLFGSSACAVRIESGYVRETIPQFALTLESLHSSAETALHQILTETSLRELKGRVGARMKEDTTKKTLEKEGGTAISNNIDPIFEQMAAALRHDPSAVDDMTRLQGQLLQLASDKMVKDTGSDLVAHSKQEATAKSLTEIGNPYVRFESGPWCIGSQTATQWQVRICPLVWWIKYPRNNNDNYWPSLKITFPKITLNGMNYTVKVGFYTEYDFNLMPDKIAARGRTLYEQISVPVNREKPRWVGYWIELWLSVSESYHDGVFLEEWVAGMVGSDLNAYKTPLGTDMTTTFLDLYVYLYFRQNLPSVDAMLGAVKKRQKINFTSKTSSWGYSPKFGATISKGNTNHKYFFDIYHDEHHRIAGLQMSEYWWFN